MRPSFAAPDIIRPDLILLFHGNCSLQSPGYQKVLEARVSYWDGRGQRPFKEGWFVTDFILKVERLSHDLNIFWPREFFQN